MSEELAHDDEEHSSGIRTPRQLVIVLLSAFVVPILVIVMLAQFVVLGDKEAPGTQSFTAAAIAHRIAPVAAVAVNDPSIPKPARTGQQVFEAQCTTCHTAGLLGSPKFGDAAAWGPRIGSGYEALLQSALHGKGNMPAQGGGDFSDYEVGRAVVYMADKGGATFADPAPPAAPAASTPATAEAGAPAAAASKSPA